MKSIFHFFPAAPAFFIATAGLYAQGTRQDFDAAGNLTTAAPTVAGLPVILKQPASRAVAPGGSAALSVFATGGVLSYQWKKAGAVIGGATADTFTLSSFTPADEADYTVTVTNASGSLTSSAATLSLDGDGDGLPDSWEMEAFGNLTASGTSDSDGDGRTNTEEYTDGTAPADSTSKLVQLTITAVNGAVTASPASVTGRYAPETLVTLTGLPAAGFEVSAWTNAAPAGVNQATILLGYNDETVTATFSRTATPVNLATALDDSTGLVFTTGGEQPWIGETGGGSHDTVDSARSGDISRFGESWIQTSVTGPGSLSFWWRTSCYSGDGMTLQVNGVSLAGLSGESFWQPVHIAIPAGAHTLRWRFVRGSASFALGANRVWLDQLLWQAGGVPELAEAMDRPDNVIASGGVLPWQAFRRFAPLAVTGFDSDVIVGSGDVAGVPASVWTAATTTDLGTSLVPVLRESAGSTGGVYLPAGGLLGDVDGAFQLESDGSNNALRVAPLDTRTLTLTTPVGQRAIRLLALSAGDDSELMCELEFTDGTRQSSVALFRDWSEDLDNSWPVALFSRTAGTQLSGYFLQTVNVPVLQENWNRQIEHITFRPTGGSAAAVAAWIFAVSGATGPVAGSDDFVASGLATDDFDGRGEESWLSMIVAGNQAVGFTWHRPEFAFNALTLDGVPLPDGFAGWQGNFHRLGAGSHVLKWNRLPRTDVEAMQIMVEGVSNSAPVPLVNALDGLTWTTGGDAGWLGYALPPVAHDGVDSGVSGEIAAGQESWVQTEFDGAGTLAFHWKLAAGATDELRLTVDGAEVHSLTGSVDWQPALHTFGSGHHIVRWSYARAPAAAAVAPDAAFLDEVSFTPGTPPVEAALDLGPGLHVFSTGAAVWLSQSGTTHDGTDALASGAVPDNADSRFFLLADGPATLSYWRRTSTSTGDRLSLYINGVSTLNASGTLDWAQELFALPAGRHTIEWRYVKDFAATAGSDTVWIDEVKWSAPVPLPDALDAPSLIWTTGGAGGWTGSDAEAHTGGSSGVSGATPHGMDSWMETSVTGPGTVSFQWMITAGTGDEVRFYVDNVLAASRAGIGTDWRPVLRTLSSGLHKLRWSYVKDAATVAGDDLARVDAVAFTAANPPPLDDSIDAPELDLVTTGPLAFFSQSTESHDGADALQSGAVDHNGLSEASVTLTGPGLLTFWWRTSSASGDQLRWILDGTQIAAISGELAWAQVVRQIGPGVHSVEWNYAKNGSTVAGSDAGWVDEVVYAPAGSLSAALDGSGLTWTTGGAGGWSGASGGQSHDGADVAHSGYLDINSSAWLETQVTGPGTFSFWWNASGSTGDVGEFSVDGSLRHSEAGASGWKPVVQTLGAGLHTLRFNYRKDGGAPTLSDGLYLDEVSFIASSPQPTAPIAEAANSALDFLTYSNAVWTVQSTTTHDAVGALQAGSIADNQESRLQSIVTGPGTLAFWWKVSSQSSNDFLRLYIDGVQETFISGEVDWTQIVRHLDGTGHVIEWRYTKNANTAAGSDTGWIDQVQWTPSSGFAGGLATALDGTGLSWTTGGSPAVSRWMPQAVSASHDTVDAAVSPPLDPLQSTWMETTVTGPGTLTFFWKVTGASGDVLTVGIGGEVSYALSGTVDWQPAGIALGSGAHTLRWTWQRGATARTLSQAAWVDEVNFVSESPASLTDAVDNSNLPLTSGSNALWLRQTAVVHDASDAAASGIIADNQESRLQYVAHGSGTLAFWWKVSSQASNDFLRLYIDGVQETFISGEVDWTQIVRHLDAGEHLIEWRYTKNASVIAGSDKGWIDQVEWTPSSGFAGGLAAALDGASLTWTTGGSPGAPAWMPQAVSASHDGVDAAISPPLDPSLQTWMETTVTGPGTLTSWWKLTGATGDVLRVQVDGEEQHSLSGTVDWQPLGTALGSGTHTVRWTWQRGVNARALGQAAWVDEVNFVPQTSAELADAVDNTGMVFTISGNSLWGRQTTTTHDGIDAAASGVINHSQETWTQTRLTGPGTLTYWRRVSSQASSDLFNFLADGVVVAAHTASGESPWTLMNYTVTGGSHLIRWRYSKNATTTAGSDAAWVDEIAFTPSLSVPLDVSLDGAGFAWTTSGGSSWTGMASTTAAHDLVDFAVSGQPAAGATSWAETSVTGPGTLSYWWRATSSAADDRMSLIMDGATTLTDVTGASATWLPVNITIGAGVHTLRWDFAPAGGVAASPGRVMHLDEVAFTAEAVPTLLASAAPSAGSTPAVVALVSSGHLPFVAQVTTTHDGSSAPASGAIANSQESWIEAVIAGPGEGGAWWNVNSHANDLYRLSIDGTNLAVISGTTGTWERPAFYLGTGQHRVRWRFIKDASTVAGLDKAFMDELVWSAGAANSLGAAIGQPSQTLLTQGPLPWLVQNTVTKDGVSALVSGAITHSQQTSLTFNSTGPGWISYWWKVSSQSGSDLLRHFEDGVQRHVISGEVDWVQGLRRSAPGTHIQEWRYNKNATTTTGSDTGWLDEVEFAAPGDLAAALDGAGLTWTTGGAAGWDGYTLEYSADGVDSASSGDIADGEESWIQTTVTGPGTIAFSSKIFAHASDILTLTVDGADSEVLDAIVWTTYQRTLGAGVHTGRWTYTKSAATVTEPDSAWLDSVSFTPGTASLADAADVSGGEFFAPGNAPWFRQTLTTHDGTDALQAGAIDHNQNSRLTMPVAGPAWLSFSRKVSSLSGDNLRWYLDGVQQTVITGEVDWQRVLAAIPPGTHTIEWRYDKNASGTAGSDSGWVDRVEVSAPGINLATALDGAGLTWTTGGAAGWDGYAMADSSDGVDSASSGDIADGAESWIQTSVTGPGTLAFTARVMAHSSDIFTLSVDGGDGQVLGATAWAEYQRTLGAGTHTVRWTYAKSAATVTEPDSAWLDDVSFTPGGAALADGADLNSGVLFAEGDLPWFRQTAVTHDGNDALQAGGIGHSQFSRLTMPVEGPVALSFWWKVSSQSSDVLRWYIDGVQQSTIAGEVDWQRILAVVPPGSHTVAWQYEKNTTVSAGSDTGWLDQVEVSVPGTNLATALDGAGLTWITGGALPWNSLVLSMAHDGVDEAVSGAVPLGQETWVETSVTGPGSLSYWIKTSTHTGDPVRFSVNGSVWRTVSGEVDWQEVQMAIPAGAHSLRWAWQNQSTSVSGENSVWLDAVNFTPAASPPLATAVSDGSGKWLTAGTLPWSLTGAAESHDGVSAARSGAITDNQTSSLFTRVEGPVLMSYWWNVSSQSGSDLLNCYVDGVFVAGISGEPGWQQVQRQIGSGSHEIEWRYSKNSSTSSGADRGWVDQIAFAPGSALATALDGAGLTWTTGGAGPWSGLAFAGAGHDGTDVAASGITGAGQESWLETAVTGPGTFNFWWRLTTASTNPLLHFELDGILYRSLGNADGWRPVKCSLPAGTHVLRWNYVAEAPAATTLNAAFVDEVSWIPADPAGLLAAADITAPALFSTGTSSTWLHQTAVTSDGADALSSGSPAHSGNAVLSAYLTGPAMVSFNWKISSAANDRLTFRSDGISQLNTGGEQDWTSKVFRIGGGRHLLEWTYLKDASVTAGSDAAYIDKITVAPPGPLAPALEGAGLTFTTGGSVPWAGYQLPASAHDGIDLASSGAITIGQDSWLETTVNGPGTLAFWWQSGASLAANAMVTVDGKEWLTDSFASAWVPVAIAVNTGPHTIRWSYSKTTTSTGTTDSVWVDEVVWSPQASPPLFAAFDATVSPVVAVGGNLWFRQTANALDAGGALENGAMNDYFDARLLTEVTGPGHFVFQHQTFGLRVLIDVDEEFTASLPDGGASWLPVTYKLGSGIHRVEWTAFGKPSPPVGSAVRLDKVSVGVPGGAALAEALDAPGLPWTTSPVLPWQGVAGPLSLSSDGVDCAQSAVNFSDGLTSWVETTVTGPGTIAFSWMTAPDFYTNLSFLVDGVERDWCDPDGQWLTAVHGIGSGTHVLRWAHGDFGFFAPSGLDQVSFTPGFGFADWQALHFNASELANPLVSGFTADPDADALTNGVEAMLGTDPHRSSGEALTAAFDDTGPSPVWVIRFTVPDTTPIDLISSVETSADMDADWNPVAESSLDVWTAFAPATVSTAASTPGFKAVTVRVPADSDRIFARFVATQP